ncbi:hypothetical protein [Roseateles sp.]|uniref:DUF7684 family protein n=1 Tax=Roseateles sp. TaxID=1971397 RepID=UPI0039E7A631
MNSCVVYQHVKPNAGLPDWRAERPFRCVTIVHEDVRPDWREAVGRWLVDSGCLYAMAWGAGCSHWENAVDEANLRNFDYGEIPQDRFVMTTCHEDEPLSKAFWFAREVAWHPAVELHGILLLHIAPGASEVEMLASFANAKD